MAIPLVVMMDRGTRDRLVVLVGGNVVCGVGELMLGPVVSAWPAPAAPSATIADPVARTAPAAMRLNQRLVELVVFIVIVMAVQCPCLVFHRFAGGDPTIPRIGADVCRVTRPKQG